MTTIDTSRPETGPTTTPPPRHRRGWFRAMVLRLHFFTGLIVGPFILVAALSGALYAMAPQLEKVVYAHELYTSTEAQNLSLDDQVQRAIEHVDRDSAAHEAPPLTSVRPAPQPGMTTRVMFAPPEGSSPSDHRAVFVSPADGEIRGDLTVYGSSGSLPLRTWIDQLHRSLHLGEPGRLYAEFAASWMWVIALGGLILWMPQLTGRLRAGLSRRRAIREAMLPTPGAQGRKRLLGWHYSAGLGLLVAMLFLSATGITWSTYGGENVTRLRAALDWSTPQARTSLTGEEAAAGEHAGHAGHTADSDDSSSMSMPLDSGYDAIMRASRRLGIGSDQVEIVPAASMDKAWTVQEIDRHYPTHVDSVTIDPMTYERVDSVSFKNDYSLPAKLARWGIDIHMGLWFGLLNQLVLFVVAIGIAAMVVTGYWMWFKRRPTLSRMKTPKSGLRSAPWWAWPAVGLPALVIGWFLPLLGLPLVAFVVVDGALAWRSSRVRGTV
ncbi:PepSY-associated TM helix domain-containing protein [Rothia uropygialis]|uniref:PepSY-associated TM helix domain-containing protein n=1 Tax=Kocuria sp. 36 TaxID=1415402 RepID=UPI00101D6402|nr:PepSY-associated TM helix domain-containing protein [Kocuria sp. 36]